jgi:hypothetical protein
VDVVINTAALSQPAMCEQDYQYARSVNVPDALISALVRQKRMKHVEALLIHISSDQVRAHAGRPVGFGGPRRPVREAAAPDSLHHAMLPCRRRRLPFP